MWVIHDAAASVSIIESASIRTRDTPQQASTTAIEWLEALPIMRRADYSKFPISRWPTRLGSGVVIALALLACASNASRFSPMPGKSFPPKDESFEVAVFDSALPPRAFERIARIDVQMAMPASENASLKDAIPELKRQARLAGADAIIDIRLQRSKAREMMVFQVSATGIRYSPN
jgi:hypothetical protein